VIYLNTLGSIKFLQKEGSRMLSYEREKGQGLAEYVLILIPVAILVIVVPTVIGLMIGNIFSKVTSPLSK
jgi:Flp pilus assembly pilin Flp